MVPFPRDRRKGGHFSHMHYKIRASMNFFFSVKIYFSVLCNFQKINDIVFFQFHVFLLCSAYLCWVQFHLLLAFIFILLYSHENQLGFGERKNYFLVLRNQKAKFLVEGTLHCL